MTLGRPGRMPGIRRRPRCAAAAALLLLCGCDAISQVGQRPPSPTGEVAITLQVLVPSQQRYEVFRVTREGKFEYGGGLRAFNGHTNWSTQLTPAQVAEFVGHVDRTGWCAERPPEQKEGEPMVNVELTCADEKVRNFTIRGSDPGVASLQAFFDPIARMRLNPILDQLPEASGGAPPAKPDAGAAPATAPATAPAPAPAPASKPDRGA